MPVKYITTLLALFSLSLLSYSSAFAEESDPVCTRLEKKASGDMLKYSLDAVVNNPVFFDDLGCGIRYREELCAMEMLSFDISAKVYDYYSAEEIEIGAAYFWLDEKNKDAPILAFSSKKSAEKYNMGKEDGVILDYPVLTDRLLK